MTLNALQYQTGIANEFATEALPGVLPESRNSPQWAPYGLYAEQLSGTDPGAVERGDPVGTHAGGNPAHPSAARLNSGACAGLSRHRRDQRDR